MKQVFIKEHNIISSLGFTTEETLENIARGKGGIACYEDESILSSPFHAPRISDQHIGEAFEGLASPLQYTRLEKLLILSVKDAVQKAGLDPSSKDVLLLISTTKGNIDLLNPSLGTLFPEDRIRLAPMAAAVAAYFRNPNVPMVLSNACISGAMAILVGKRLIDSGQYKNVVISGVDILSQFTVSGFHSFKAMGSGPCRPYDETRDGISLGEACSTIVLSQDSGRKKGEAVRVAAGAVSNDANHISGPSRTGEGLYIAIRKTLAAAEVREEDIGYISAHGTATVYNDEMEAKAFTTAGLQEVPLNSMKGYFGHTLGAAGVIESVIAAEALRTGALFRSMGYDKRGTTVPLNIIIKNTSVSIKAVLKTASGFGGCNAALLFCRE